MIEWWVYENFSSGVIAIRLDARRHPSSEGRGRYQVGGHLWPTSTKSSYSPLRDL
jgi:hypothetical protein